MDGDGGDVVADLAGHQHQHAVPHHLCHLAVKKGIKNTVQHVVADLTGHQHQHAITHHLCHLAVKYGITNTVQQGIH